MTIFDKIRIFRLFLLKNEKRRVSGSKTFWKEFQYHCIHGRCYSADIQPEIRYFDIYDGLRYNFSESLKIAVSERFLRGYKRASKIMNNQDIDKPLKMATLEQKRVSQIQGFVKIVPQKKSRSI